MFFAAFAAFSPALLSLLFWFCVLSSVPLPLPLFVLFVLLFPAVLWPRIRATSSANSSSRMVSPSFESLVVGSGGSDFFSAALRGAAFSAPAPLLGLPALGGGSLGMSAGFTAFSIVRSLFAAAGFAPL